MSNTNDTNYFDTTQDTTKITMCLALKKEWTQKNAGHIVHPGQIDIKSRSKSRMILKNTYHFKIKIY